MKFSSSLVGHGDISFWHVVTFADSRGRGVVVIKTWMQSSPVKRSNVVVRFFVALWGSETWEGTSKKSTRHDSNPLLAFASSSKVGRKASSQDTISLPKENSPTLDRINLLKLGRGRQGNLLDMTATRFWLSYLFFREALDLSTNIISRKAVGIEVVEIRSRQVSVLNMESKECA
ncbi:hypothetical protein OROMI_016645 [Orobanche minor]